MSYEKTTWQAGDKVTAAKLNKLEDRAAAGPILYLTGTISDNICELDGSYNDVVAAIANNQVVAVKIPQGENIIDVAYIKEYGVYNNEYYIDVDLTIFSANSATDNLIAEAGMSDNPPSGGFNAS